MTGGLIVCLLMLAAVVLARLPVWDHFGTPLCYLQFYVTDTCRITIQEWGKEGTDPDGECVQVRMVWLDGRVYKCQFEVSDRVVDSWVCDLDGDENPEAVVVSQSFGTGVYGMLYVVTITTNGLSLIEETALVGEMDEGYEGHDSYRRAGSKKIVRLFPVRESNGRYIGRVRRIVYVLKDKQLIVSESQDISEMPADWLLDKDPQPEVESTFITE